MGDIVVVCRNMLKYDYDHKKRWMIDRAIGYYFTTDISRIKIYDEYEMIIIWANAKFIAHMIIYDHKHKKENRALKNTKFDKIMRNIIYNKLKNILNLKKIK